VGRAGDLASMAMAFSPGGYLSDAVEIPTTQQQTPFLGEAPPLQQQLWDPLEDRPSMFQTPLFSQPPGLRLALVDCPRPDA